jgi:hypothetical protein
MTCNFYEKYFNDMWIPVFLQDITLFISNTTTVATYQTSNIFIMWKWYCWMITEIEHF